MHLTALHISSIDSIQPIYSISFLFGGVYIAFYCHLLTAICNWPIMPAQTHRARTNLTTSMDFPRTLPSALHLIICNLNINRNWLSFSSSFLFHHNFQVSHLKCLFATVEADFLLSFSLWLDMKLPFVGARNLHNGPFECALFIEVGLPSRFTKFILLWLLFTVFLLIMQIKLCCKT